MSDFTAFVSNFIDIDTQIYHHWLSGIGVHQAISKQYSHHSENFSSLANVNSSSMTPFPSEVDKVPIASAITSNHAEISNTSSPSLSSIKPTLPSAFSSGSSSTSSSANSSTSSLARASRSSSTEKPFSFPNVFTGVRRAMESVVDNWITYPSFPLPFGNTQSATTPGRSSTSTTCTVDPSLNLHVITQYRWFTCIEPFLHRPCSLDHATIFKLTPTTRQVLIDGYYTFDDTLMREIVGKKLTARLRRDLDEGGIPGISLTSARRQFDNLKRILKKTEEAEVDMEGIETYFKLSPDLTRRYTNVLFLYRHKIHLHKRKLFYLTYADIDACTTWLRLLSPVSLSNLKSEDNDSSKLRCLKNVQSILSKDSLKTFFVEVHEKLVELISSLGWGITEVDAFFQSLKQQDDVGAEMIDHFGSIVVRMIKAFSTAKLKKVSSATSTTVDHTSLGNFEAKLN